MTINKIAAGYLVHEKDRVHLFAEFPHMMEWFALLAAEYLPDPLKHAPTLGSGDYFQLALENSLFVVTLDRGKYLVGYQPSNNNGNPVMRAENMIPCNSYKEVGEALLQLATVARLGNDQLELFL